MGGNIELTEECLDRNDKEFIVPPLVLDNGNVQLWNGDCLDKMKYIKDKSVDMILTDPPYGMNYQSKWRKKAYDKIANDKSLDWVDNFYKDCYRVLKENTAIYSFCSWHNIDVFKVSFEKYFNLKNILIWEKNNTSMGDLKASYAPKYEMILYGHKGRRELEGFRYPDIIKADKTRNEYHPTEKPVDLLKILIKNSSKEGDLILDPFMGSGSTMVACVNTNRKGIGIELEKEYFNNALYRLNKKNSDKQLSFF